MAEEKKKTNYSRAWAEARKIIWTHRRRISLGMLLLLISRPAAFVVPLSLKFVIDDVIAAKRMDRLWILALVFVLAPVIQATCSFLLALILGVAGQRAITDMRRQVQRHILHLPTQFFDSTKTGVLVSRIMTDPDGLRNLVGTGFTLMIGGIIQATAAIAFLFYFDWRLTTVIVVVLIIFGMVMVFAFSRLRPLFRQRGEIMANITGRLNETLGGIRTVRAYTAEKREEIVFTQGAHGLFRNIAKSITGVSATTNLSTAIFGVVSGAMLIIGGGAIIRDAMTAGEFIRYVGLIFLVAVPISQMASIGTQFTDAFAGLDRIREILNVPTELEEDAGRDALPEMEGDIEFKNVWFEYDEGVPVLRDVSFKSPPGSTTALVGSSGSGKSTLISLAMAFNRPTKGEIRVDGKDLSSIRLHDFRSHLGVVLQDNFLFDGTIAENIRYARPNATLDEVVAVSRIAHCDEFIEKFENGYDSIVGERGVKLSGGQRQRVAIARAILANPRLLILDEATSSLDSESEALIQDGLESLRQGRTTFVIAHRLSTIQSADQILVLEEGRIVERGTHDELLAERGRYRELYDKQYRYEMNRFINPGEEFVEEVAKT